MAQPKSERRLRSPAAVLCRYFLASYVAVAVASAPFLIRSWRGGALADLYSVSLFLTYSAFYLLPALSLTAVLFLLLSVLPSVGAARARAIVAQASALLLVTLVQFAIVIDQIVVGEFGFHLNGFVLNLVTTPGGLESMGLGEALPWTCAVVLLGLFAVQSALLCGARSRLFRPSWLRLRVYLYLAAALILLSGAEHLTYILADARSDAETLAQARAFPLYRARTARKLARSWGLEVNRNDEVAELETDASPLEYPLRAIDVDAPAQPLNVVWLVGESLRWDALSPEIMPATWDLSQRAWRFSQHFSGGNGTRMGVFSMFYGLYGSYWFSFLNERRGPLLIDVLRAQDYQMGIYTSARFSYPEFDRTVFTSVPARDLHDSADSYYSGSLDAGWKNDRRHTSEILDFLDDRDRSRPFFVYMFFESTHFRYYFPPENAIRKPYWEDMTYSALGGHVAPGLVKNRYLNAANHLDSQIGRILDALSEAGDLDKTVVIITGDHGEEFMEKGRRGHNSEFHDEQVHVPLVLWMPGSSPRRIDDLTSHVDLSATLLPLLGVTNRPEDYTLGYDLSGSDRHAYVVSADWSRVAVIEQEFKLTVPVGGGGVLENTELTTHDDAEIAAPAEEFRAVRPHLARVMSDLHRFRAAGARLRLHAGGGSS